MRSSSIPVCPLKWIIFSDHATHSSPFSRFSPAFIGLLARLLNTKFTERPFIGEVIDTVRAMMSGAPVETRMGDLTRLRQERKRSMSGETKPVPRVTFGDSLRGAIHADAESEEDDTHNDREKGHADAPRSKADGASKSKQVDRRTRGRS